MRGKGGDYSRHHRTSFWQGNNKGKSSNIPKKITACERRNKEKILVNPEKKSSAITEPNLVDEFLHPFLEDEIQDIQTILNKKEADDSQSIKELLQTISKMPLVGSVRPFSTHIPACRFMSALNKLTNPSLSVDELDSFLQNKQSKEHIFLAAYKNTQGILFFQDVTDEIKKIEEKTTLCVNPSPQ